MRQTALIHLSQIEQGMEILEKLQKLQTSVDSFCESHQYIVTSNDIYIKKEERAGEYSLRLNEEYIKALKESIVNMILDEKDDEGNPIAFGVVQDILFKLEILLRREAKYKLVTDGLNEVEILEVQDLVNRNIEELMATFKIELENEMQLFIQQEIEKTNSEINNSIAQLRTDLTTTNVNLGDLRGLHPFILNSINPNISAKDTLNFVFQLLLDINDNILKINSALGENAVELTNTYGVELPNPLEVPEDLSTLATESVILSNYDLQQENISDEEESNEDESDFENIADMVKYRLNLDELFEE